MVIEELQRWKSQQAEELLRLGIVAGQSSPGRMASHCSPDP
jgi:hypothetical protein